jgi:RNA polymerase sigma-70 factor, ECF subfamily
MDCNWDHEDGNCVRRCLQGDTEAFDELVVRYQRPVFNAIYRLVNDYEDARELSQTAFLKAFMNLRRFDHDKRFFSWLYRIAVNEALNFVAGKRKVEPIDPSMRSTEAGPVELLESKVTASHIEAAMATLSPEYRAAVVLRHFLDLSYDEAADVLEIPVKTFKSRLYSARQILRERLLAKGYDRGKNGNA